MGVSFKCCFQFLFLPTIKNAHVNRIKHYLNIYSLLVESESSSLKPAIWYEIEENLNEKNRHAYWF